MRYLTLLQEESRPDGPPPEGLMEAIMNLGAEASAAGALLDNGGLLPSVAGGSEVRLTQGELSVVDGPFAEAKEFVSYAVYEVRSKEEALEWTSRFMRAHQDLWPGWSGTSFVVKLVGPEDFPAEP